MNRVGLLFIAEGEYVEHLQHLDDPEDELWKPFEMQDLHPAGRKWFTIWSDSAQLDEKLQQEMIERAIVVADWMRGEKRWEGFCAKLFLQRKGAPIAVFEWELC